MLPISGDQLIQFIPQKPPFVLISSLTEINQDTCVTTFSFDRTHVLTENGKLSAAGLLENMAQSAGCKMGYEDFITQKKSRRGFIGEIKDFQFTRLPESGEELITEIYKEGKVFGAVTLIAGRIRSGNEPVASCRMKVFFEPEPEEPSTT